jgi:hypothetical protein
VQPVVAYLAYGANMAEGVMQAHCPRYAVAGIAELPGHRFAFTRRSIRTGTGVADVVAHAESSVWGVLYEVQDLHGLDGKEGAGWAYVHYRVTVRVGDDAREAMTYQVREPEPAEVRPGSDYIAAILAAARTRGLPAEYIKEIAELARAASSSGRPP